MWVRGDLHIHTTYSPDSTISPKLLVREALQLELDVIAVTDHNTYQGALVVEKLAKNYSEELLVILGVELETEDGEIIILTMNPIERLPKTLEETLDLAYEEGGVVIVPHPFDRWRKGIGELVYSIRADGIEVFNPWSSPKANKKAVEAAKILNLSMIASSDAHTSEYIGCAYTLLNVRETSVEEVFKALRNRMTRPVGSYPPVKDRFKSRAKKLMRKTGFYEEYDASP